MPALRGGNKLPGVSPGPPTSLPHGWLGLADRGSAGWMFLEGNRGLRIRGEVSGRWERQCYGKAVFSQRNRAWGVGAGGGGHVCAVCFVCDEKSLRSNNTNGAGAKACFAYKSRRGKPTPTQPRSDLVLSTIGSEALKFFLGKK